LDVNDQINEAIERCVRTGWSDEVAQEITTLHGADAAARARAVYKDAMNCPAAMGAPKMEDALDAMHAFLDERYPWLSPGARTNLNYCCIMAWK
jgi:hypothetical protein